MVEFYNPTFLPESDLVTVGFWTCGLTAFDKGCRAKTPIIGQIAFAQASPPVAGGEQNPRAAAGSVEISSAPFRLFSSAQK